MTIQWRNIMTTPRKTVTVEITKMEAWNLFQGAKRHLGHIVSEYDGREAFRYLIDEAKSDVAKWQAVLDQFGE